MNLILVIVASLLTGCGTYRSGHGGYRSGNGGYTEGSGGYKSGVGDYRTGSDYAPSREGGYYLSEKIPRGQNYVPRGEFKLYWPVSRVEVSRGFKPSSDPDHQGVDLRGKRGSPILAAHEGMVIYTGRDFRGYGNMVLIEYNKQWATLYGHLNEILVDEGRIVRPGDPIGTMGATGRASGVHLHFELIREREPIDPLPLLTRGSSVASRR